MVIQGEQGSITQLQRLLQKNPSGFAVLLFRSTFFINPGDDFNVMFPEPVQPERLGRGMDFAIGADFVVSMFGSPLGYFGVKTFAIFHHGRQ